MLLFTVTFGGLLPMMGNHCRGESLFSAAVLLVEAAQVTVLGDQPWRAKFFHLAMRRGRKIAKVMSNSHQASDNLVFRAFRRYCRFSNSVER